MGSNQYSGAISYLTQAARFDPSSYSAYVHTDLAKCFRKQKNHDKALAEGKKALSFNANHSDALYEMAQIKWDSADYRSCVEYLRKFISNTKDQQAKQRASKFLKDVDLFNKVNAGSELIKKGKFRSAIKEFDGAAKYDPSRFSATIHRGLAFSCGQIGKSERAISEGKKTLSLDPTDKDTVYNTAIAYQDLGNFSESIKWLNRYLTMETDANQRNSARTFLIELREDNKHSNNKANKFPDYMNHMGKKSIVRWSKNDLPLKVHIANGKGIRGYKKSFDNFILESLDTWCEASGKKLNYKIVSEPAGADIRVRWQQTKLVGRNANDHRLKAGLTQLNGNDDRIKGAIVDILTVQAFDTTKPVEGGVCASVCMHEIGHALGLGHSTYLYDVMYFRSSSKQTGKPTSRDKATIARLYKGYPALAYKPKASGQKIKYLPPPTFLPPSKPRTGKLMPPLFIPPPKREKLSPPLFKPPPKNSRPSAPTFLPPRKSRKTVKPRSSKGKQKIKPPLFLPPPK